MGDSRGIQICQRAGAAGLATARSFTHRHSPRNGKIRGQTRRLEGLQLFIDLCFEHTNQPIILAPGANSPLPFHGVAHGTPIYDRAMPLNVEVCIIYQVMQNAYLE